MHALKEQTVCEGAEIYRILNVVLCKIRHIDKEDIQISQDFFTVPFQTDFE